MGEPKPSASLSSGLLARKGAARPAMRRQGIGAHSSSTHDDLGWNDMGYDVDTENPNNAAQRPPLALSGVSPLSVKPGAADHSNDLDDEDGHDDNIAVLTNSPLSVKPGKPAVVQQQEDLEESFGDRSHDFDEDSSDDEDFAVDEDLPEPDEQDVAGRTASLLSVKPEFERDIRLNTEIGEEPLDTDFDADDPIDVIAEKADALLEDAFEAPDVDIADAKAKAKPVVKNSPKTPKLPKSRSSKDKAAFTLRIDRERHLKLRLTSAVTGKSAQQILTEAFDKYLETLPEVEALAGNIGDRATK